MLADLPSQLLGKRRASDERATRSRIPDPAAPVLPKGGAGAHEAGTIREADDSPLRTC